MDLGLFCCRLLLASLKEIVWSKSKAQPKEHMSGFHNSDMQVTKVSH